MQKWRNLKISDINQHKTMKYVRKNGLRHNFHFLLTLRLRMTPFGVQRGYLAKWRHRPLRIAQNEKWMKQSSFSFEFSIFWHLLHLHSYYSSLFMTLFTWLFFLLFFSFSKKYSVAKGLISWIKIAKMTKSENIRHKSTQNDEIRQKKWIKT